MFNLDVHLVLWLKVILLSGFMVINQIDLCVNGC